MLLKPVFQYNFSVRKEELHATLMSKSRWGESKNTMDLWWCDFNVNDAFCKCSQHIFFKTRDLSLLITTAKASTKSKNALWKLTEYITRKKLGIHIKLKIAINIGRRFQCYLRGHCHGIWLRMPDTCLHGRVIASKEDNVSPIIVSSGEISTREAWWSKRTKISFQYLFNVKDLCELR